MSPSQRPRRLRSLGREPLLAGEGAQGQADSPPRCFIVCAAVEALPAGFCVGRTDSALRPLSRGPYLFPANFWLCPETFSCSGPPIFSRRDGSRARSSPRPPLMPFLSFPVSWGLTANQRGASRCQYYEMVWARLHYKGVG